MLNQVQHDNIGTEGLLSTSKKRGIIPEIKPIFNALKKLGYYLSEAVLEKAVALSEKLQVLKC